MSSSGVDLQVYEEELSPWLPPKIIDCHVHIGLAEHCDSISPERIAGNWAMELAREFSWEDLRDTYGLLFPGREVSSLVFGGVFQETHVEENNAYILSGVCDPANVSRGLFVTRPEWDASVIARAMEAGFAGIKPYPDLAPGGAGQAGVFDFVPREHLATLNELGGVLMLHLPRKGRLADPDNVRELIEITDRFPAVKLIVAHIGRSYCLPTVLRGLPYFAEREGVYFDTAANLNADVFQYALETIGPDRLLFGSDLPVTLMRGMREHVGEQYVNYTDGPYSWNTNRKSPREEADYTYYLYEELRALVRAVEQSGLGKDAIEKVMYLNAVKLLDM